ncbi:MAG: PspC domain-containing protein [Patescibacteria group bacterium]|jgi:phage shock protein C
MTDTPKKLRRSRQDRVIAGVCGGLAEYLAIDSTIVRIVFALLTVIPNGVGLLAYIILAIVVPEEPVIETAASDGGHDSAGYVRVTNGRVETSENTSWLSQRRNIIGLVIIVLGVASLMKATIPSLIWADHVFWPMMVILIGIYLIFTTKRK